MKILFYISSTNSARHGLMCKITQQVDPEIPVKRLLLIIASAIRGTRNNAILRRLNRTLMTNSLYHILVRFNAYSAGLGGNPARGKKGWFVEYIRL